MIRRLVEEMQAEAADATLTSHLSLPDMGSDSVPRQAQKAVGFRPPSARTQFILSCVESQIAPQPSLILRKHMSSSLNITSKYIGDNLAIILAASLDRLPLLEELLIADNKLTDPGLTAMINALSLCPHLTKLDISRNKVDTEAAEALRAYLTSPACSVVSLAMKSADVDDLEAASFVQVRAYFVRLSLCRSVFSLFSLFFPYFFLIFLFFPYFFI